MGDEFDFRPLIQALDERGHAVVLPVTPQKRQPFDLSAVATRRCDGTRKFGTIRPDPVEMCPTSCWSRC